MIVAVNGPLLHLADRILESSMNEYTGRSIILLMEAGTFYATARIFARILEMQAKLLGNFYIKIRGIFDFEN